MAQRITPFLWFDDQAEEAANFYVAVFGDAEILDVNPYPPAGPGDAGRVMTVAFRLRGQEFLALNGGPQNKSTEAISFYVECESQEEIDAYWAKLSDGGEPGACGWLKDRFGVSWQITPSVLLTMERDQDRDRADRVMRAMLRMTKIDIAALERAYQQA